MLLTWGGPVSPTPHWLCASALLLSDPRWKERGSRLSPCERRGPVSLEIETPLSKSGFSPDGKKKTLSRNKVLFLELEEAQPSLVLTPESLRASSPLGRGGWATHPFPLVLRLPPAGLAAAWCVLGEGAGLWPLKRAVRKEEFGVMPSSCPSSTSYDGVTCCTLVGMVRTASWLPFGCCADW